MTQRWTQLNTIFSGSKNFTINSVQGTLFLWLRCVGFTISCTQVFSDAGINGRFGNGEMGNENGREYIRLNLVLRNSSWSLFIERLIDLVQSVD